MAQPGATFRTRSVHVPEMTKGGCEAYLSIAIAGGGTPLEGRSEVVVLKCDAAHPCHLIAPVQPRKRVVRPVDRPSKVPGSRVLHLARGREAFSGVLSDRFQK